MSKLNLFLTGQAGTGKTYLIKEMEKEWIKNGSKYAILCPTGVAAVSIGGNTLHRWFGIGLGRGSGDDLLKACRKKVGITKKIREVDIIVIDEISMVSADLLEKLNYICQQVRRSVLIFGGIRMVISGDFLQLPPIDGEFAFKSPIWQDFDFEVKMLTEPKRFNDPSYWKMLMRARSGFLKRKDVARLNERVQAFKNGEHLASPIKPTMLYSYRADVDAINKSELDKIKEKEWWYYAVDDAEGEKSKSLLDATAPAAICLKKGAQVMCTSNLDLEAGICNGSRGIVVECSTDNVRVLFKNGQEYDITVVEWEVEDFNTKIRRSQIPLSLAWALTVHKSQSLTIDCVLLSLDHTIFSPGQCYVALSRTRSYSSLYLQAFTEKAIFCSPEAKKFYEELETNN